MPGLTLNTLFCAALLGAWLTTLPLADDYADDLFRAHFWNLGFVKSRLFVHRTGLPVLVSG